MFNTHYLSPADQECAETRLYVDSKFRHTMQDIAKNVSLTHSLFMFGIASDLFSKSMNPIDYRVRVNFLALCSA